MDKITNIEWTGITSGNSIRQHYEALSIQQQCARSILHTGKKVENRSRVKIRWKSGSGCRGKVGHRADGVSSGPAGVDHGHRPGDNVAHLGLGQVDRQEEHQHQVRIVDAVGKNGQIEDPEHL